MIKTLIHKVENMPMSFWQGVIILYIIVLLRTIIESFVNIAFDGKFAGFFGTLFVQPFWFFCAFLTLFIIFNLLTKEKIEKTSKFGIIISPLMFIPPIVDILLKGPWSVYYVFVQGSSSELLFSYLTFFLNTGIMVSIGMKIAALVLLGLSAAYIFSKTKNWKKALLGVFLVYTIFSFYSAIPSYIFASYNFISKDYAQIGRASETDFYFSRDPMLSNTKNRTIIFDNNFSNNDSVKFKISPEAENNFYMIIAVALWIMSLFLLSAWFALYDKEKFKSIFRNFRYLRIILYFSLVFIGISLGSLYSGKWPVNSLFDITSIASIYLALLFAGLFSIWENDEIDVEIDKISNRERPLPQGKLSLKEWREIKYFFLILSLGFSFLSGYYTLLLILTFLATYHIYSAPPLRLKGIPVLSSALIGFLTLVSVWLGFFISSGTEKVYSFPLRYSFGIWCFFFLIENFKNIKDIKGDRLAKIKTLPAILGEENGKFITGLLAWLAPFALAISFLFNLYTFLTAFIFGFIFFFLINRKNYREKYVFFAIYLFIVSFSVEFYLLS